MLTGIWDVQHYSVWFSDVRGLVRSWSAAFGCGCTIGPRDQRARAELDRDQRLGRPHGDHRLRRTRTATHMPRRTSRSNARERQRRLGRRFASPGVLGSTRIFPTALSSTRTRAARSCWTAPTMSFGRGSSTRPVRRDPGRRAASPRPLQPRPSRSPSTTPCRRRHRAGSTLQQEPHSGPPAGRC